MRRLALAILLAAPLPAAAQGCAGVADTAVMLIQDGWVAHSGGITQGGDMTIFTHSDGRWIAIYINGNQACLVSQGIGWATIKPNA